MQRCAYRGVTLMDLVLSLVCIALLVPAVLCAVPEAKERENRIKCAKNLQQIWKGLVLYGSDNQNPGTYPRGRSNALTDEIILPESKPGAAFPNNQLPGGFSLDSKAPINDVGLAIYLLAKKAEVPLTAFVCPSSSQVPDPNQRPADLQQRTSFTSTDNLSYSFTNPYPAAEAIKRGYRWHGSVKNPEFVIAADRNDSGGDPTQLRSNSPMPLQMALNSRNHQSVGQNALFADGHIEWQGTSFMGAAKDCIYTPASVLAVGNTGPWRQKDPAANEAYGKMQPNFNLDSVLVPWAGGGFPNPKDLATRPAKP